MDARKINRLLRKKSNQRKPEVPAFPPFRRLRCKPSRVVELAQRELDKLQWHFDSVTADEEVFRNLFKPTLGKRQLQIVLETRGSVLMRFEAFEAYRIRRDYFLTRIMQAK